MTSGALPREGPGDRSLPRRAPDLALRTSAVSALAFAVVCVAGPALAGVLVPTSGVLSGGTAAVTACGNAAAAVVSYEVTNGAVTAVTVTGLPSTCNGASLQLTLTNNGSAVATAGPVVVTGESASLPALSANPIATAVTDAQIALIG